MSKNFLKFFIFHLLFQAGINSFGNVDEIETLQNKETDSEKIEAEASLEEIEVSAYKFSANALEIPVNARVISLNEIRASTASTISEVLRREGNLQFMSFSGNDAEGNLALRGFGENSQTRVAVFVDSQKYNPSDMSSINWTQIPLASVESIEILRGPQSVMYGGNAEAGVVKISTLRPRDDVEFFARGMMGSYGLYTAAASVAGGIENFFYSANISTYNNDGYRQLSKAWANSASMGAGYKISDSLTFQAKGDYSESFSQYPNALDWDTFQNNPRSATSSTKYKNKAGVYTANLKSNSTAGQGEAVFGVNFRDRTIDALTRNDQWTYTLSPHYEIDKFDNLKIRFGLDADFSNINFAKDRILSNTRVNYMFADVNRADAGAFAETSWEFAKNLTLSVGGRAEAAYTSAEYTELRYIFINTPPTIVAQYNENAWNAGLAASAGLNYRLSKESSVYARFDQIYHYPTTDEMASYQGYGVNVFTFNKDLKPEHGQNYEVGFKYLDENWKANISTFALFLNDEIQWDDSVKKNVNLAETLRYGLDFDAGYESKYWGISLAGSLVSAQFLNGPFDGNNIPLVPAFYGSAEIYAKPLECAKIIFRANYSTSSTMGNDFENNTRTIPSYYTFDLQMNLEIYEHFQVFAAIENLSDENYATFAYKGSGFYPNAGRTFKIGINIKL